ncbi:MAG: PaeR7I family type II restriction endonuclease [Rhodothermales bacterium]
MYRNEATGYLFADIETRPKKIVAALEQLSASEAEERGAIFTRREVVEFILDLAGYTVDKKLAEHRLLEPSFGEGDFLCAIIERLLVSYLEHGGTLEEVHNLASAIRAVELHPKTFEQTRRHILKQLASQGVTREQATKLTDQWLIQDDFLLTNLPATFTHVVGNPPYVRQERIPDPLLQEYRRRYQTIYDRADLYVPFIEKGLSLLSLTGKLAFICSDRWTKNKYGRPLRKLVAERYHLRYFVDMHQADAFRSGVTAYPAIFIITREHNDVTKTVCSAHVNTEALQRLTQVLLNSEKSDVVHEAVGVVRGDAPWLLEAPEEVSVLRNLEGRFPALTQAGCKVGIGVATGCDTIYVRKGDELPVEESRKLPLAVTRDVQNGIVGWSGWMVLNPFDDSGHLVSLDQYPLFAAYLLAHEQRIRNRNVARKNPKQWYRTIDKIHTTLIHTPKLFIPDIKGTVSVAYDEGKYYPHHNLYYIISDDWDLRALQAVLRSAVAEFVVAMYCVKMRGGYLRFQAQYLRRIRLPRWADVPEHLRQRLRAAGRGRSLEACDRASFELYSLDKSEQDIVLNAVGREAPDIAHATHVSEDTPPYHNEHMGLNLKGFNELAAQAVKYHWEVRKGEHLEEGKRPQYAIRAGKHLDGIVDLLETIAKQNGPDDLEVHRQRAYVSLPGFYRATKEWDLVITHQGQLIAAVEIKSQVGSVGNNFNNRCEELLGSAVDLLDALKEGAFGKNAPKPFMGYLMVMEDNETAHSPVATSSEHFAIFQEFQDASYAERYQIACRKVVHAGLYDAAALILSPEDKGYTTGLYVEPNLRYGLRQLVKSLAAKVAALTT